MNVVCRECGSSDKVDEGYAVVCRGCGLSIKLQKPDEFNISSAPLTRNYEREGRFMTKVDKLLGILSPKYQDPVWSVLSSSKEMSGSQDIRKVLRHSSLKDKHYDCVRTFTLLFTPTTSCLTSPQKVRAYLRAQFKTIHSRWRSLLAVSPSISLGFFSYDWLLRKFLEEGDLPDLSRLVKFLKPRTSKRRAKKYQTLLNRLPALK